MSVQWMPKAVPQASSSRNGSTWGFNNGALLTRRALLVEMALCHGSYWMQTSSEKHLHYPKILPPSNKMPDAGRQKSMNFVATECPDDTSKEVGDEVGLQRGGRGPPVKHEQTKKHQKNLEILLLQYICKWCIAHSFQVWNFICSKLWISKLISERSWWGRSNGGTKWRTTTSHKS